MVSTTWLSYLVKKSGDADQNGPRTRCDWSFEFIIDEDLIFKVKPVVINFS